MVYLGHPPLNTSYQQILRFAGVTEGKVNTVGQNCLWFSQTG